MRILVLGSAAGGGFPQWNCGCQNCAGVRDQRATLRPRTQASLAVSGDEGSRWLLLGASPDVRHQIESASPLRPRSLRQSPIADVALVNGDVDTWAGLLSLREWSPLNLFATEVVRADLLANPVMRTLERFAEHSRWCSLLPGAPVTVAEGLTLEAIPVLGKPPLHATGRVPSSLDNVGFIVREGSKASLGWFPAVAGPSIDLRRAVQGLDVLFFDGTFFRDDELLVEKVGTVCARQMGHWPVGGSEGSAFFLRDLPVREKWLVHINNTNPLLRDDSIERAELQRFGIEVAYDLLELRIE
jgi:pyrroloquinoline quinone biosynthesis protein B